MKRQFTIQSIKMQIIKTIADESSVRTNCMIFSRFIGGFPPNPPEFRTTVLLCCLIVVACGCRRQVSTSPAANLATALTLRTALEEAGGGTARDDSAISTAEPTGFATLKGSFVIRGNPPPNPDINVNKDADVCGASAKDLQLVVTPPQDGGGIANILVFAEGIPAAWAHESAKPGKSDEFIFDQKKCVFLTRVAAYQVSQKFKILNSDPTGHNTSLDPRYNSRFNETIPVGSFAYYQAEREEKEPVSVRCSIHPWMQAWMIPRDNSYFAVTKKDGSFEIPSLPAGVALTFRVWHERPKFIAKVTVDGQQEKWSKGRFTRTLQPDSTEIMPVVIDASEFE